MRISSTFFYVLLYGFIALILVALVGAFASFGRGTRREGNERRPKESPYVVPPLTKEGGRRILVGVVVVAALLVTSAWSYHVGGNTPNDGKYPQNCTASADGSAFCYGGHNQALIQACEAVMTGSLDLEQLCSATDAEQKAAEVRLAGG